MDEGIGQLPTRVYFEEGKHSVFAVAIGWPGWCRRAKTNDLALEELLEYQDRYAAVLSVPFKPGKLEVVGAIPGNATTDFGAPGVESPWDYEPMTTRELKRQLSVLGGLLGVLRRRRRRRRRRRFEKDRAAGA